MKKLLGCFALILSIVALTAPAHAQSGYGASVAVGDEEVFVGEAGNVISSGFVYVYRQSADGWKEVAKLSASDASDRDRFGRSVHVDGDLLLVAGGTGTGNVYVFERAGGEWAEVGVVTSTDGAEGDGFGASIDSSGDLMIIGASGHNERQGAAYVFERGAAGFSEVAKLVATNPTPEQEEAAAGRRGGRRGGQAAGGGGGGGRRGGRGANAPPMFGSAVAIDGDWAMVSAPNYGSRTGSVYVFKRDSGDWQQVAQLPGNNAQPGAVFGASILVESDEMFIGATTANGGIGGVSTYRLIDDERWVRTGNLVPFDGQPGGSFGGAMVVDGNVALVGASGAGGRAGRIYRYERDVNGNWTDATKLGASGITGGDRFGSVMAANGDVVAVGVPGDDFGAGTAIVMTRSDFGWSTEKILSPVANYPMVTGTDDGIECRDGMAGSFPCANVDLISYLPVHEMGGVRGLATNDAWGWTDPDTDRDYAIIGMRDRASFVDVTDPYNPVYVGIMMKTEGSRTSAWRDMKVRNNWVYIVSDGAGEHGMQIFNLEHLRDFDGEPVEFEPDYMYDGVGSTHNIVINPDTDYAYAVGADGPCGGALHIINIEDPSNPTFEGCFQDTNTGRGGSGATHDAMCITYVGPDDRYAGHEICFSSNGTALSIADVTDKRNPVALSAATYPNVAYSHQGWITEDHKYFYMNDELDEGRGLVEGTRTLIWDVQDLEDPILAKEYISDNPATDHNLYINGDIMYQSNYDSGLRVYDISDPENPEPLGFFDTVPYQEGGGMTGSWSNYPFFDSGIIVVTSGREGMVIVKVRN